MRKTIIFLMLVLGMVVLLGMPAFAGQREGDDRIDVKTRGRNYDILTDLMDLGHDYTRTWVMGGYTAWDSADNWGGWYWASQFIAPCPQWLKQPSEYSGWCDWTVPTGYEPNVEAQTDYGDWSDGHEDAFIVDDLYARVVDNWLGATVTIYTSKDGDPEVVPTKGILDQDLDILFATYPQLKDDGTADPDAGYMRHVIVGPDGAVYSTNLLIDQSIDQQLAYWEDVNDDDHIGGAVYVATAYIPVMVGTIQVGTETIGAHDIYIDTNENGLTQRLVAEFGIDIQYKGAVSTSYVIYSTADMEKAEWVDQWVVQWLRDIDVVYSASNARLRGKEGIEQYYSSWFQWGEEFECDPYVCQHTYNLDHPTVTKGVEKADHDHNPLDDTTYGTKTDGRAWDP